MRSLPDSLPRRGFLASTLPVMALIGSTGALAAAAPHPDAALLALGTRALALVVASDTAADSFTAAEEMCSEATAPVPVRPRDVQHFGSDADYREAIRRYEIDRADYETRVAQIEARIGLAALEEASVEADEAARAALYAIAATRAATLEGITLKARIVGKWKDECLLDSIVADLLAMGGNA